MTEPKSLMEGKKILVIGAADFSTAVGAQG